MLNEYHNDEDNDQDTRIRKEDGFIYVTLPEKLMEQLERRAAAAGRSVDEQAEYILKVNLGLRAADPNDTAGRQLAMIFKRMRRFLPLEG